MVVTGLRQPKERLQKSIKELTQRSTREQQEIDNYLNTLNVE